MKIRGQPVPKVATERKWAICPICGMKATIIDDTANCHGVWVKCTRGCRSEFELIVIDGKQVISQKA